MVGFHNKRHRIVGIEISKMSRPEKIAGNSVPDVTEANAILITGQGMEPSAAGLRWYFEQSDMDYITWLGAMGISPVLQHVVGMMMKGHVPAHPVIYESAQDIFLAISISRYETEKEAVSRDPEQLRWFYEQTNLTIEEWLTSIGLSSNEKNKVQMMMDGDLPVDADVSKSASVYFCQFQKRPIGEMPRLAA